MNPSSTASHRKALRITPLECFSRPNGRWRVYPSDNPRAPKGFRFRQPPKVRRDETEQSPKFYARTNTHSHRNTANIKMLFMFIATPQNPKQTHEGEAGQAAEQAAAAFLLRISWKFFRNMTNIWNHRNDAIQMGIGENEKDELGVGPEFSSFALNFSRSQTGSRPETPAGISGKLLRCTQQQRCHRLRWAGMSTSGTMWKEQADVAWFKFLPQYTRGKVYLFRVA